MNFPIISRFLSLFCNIHEFNVTNLFLWSIFTITSILLTLQMQLVEYMIPCNHSSFTNNRSIFFLFLLLFLKSENILNPFDIISFVFLVFWSLVAIFVVCEIGERATAAYASFDYTLCQCDWYLYPIKMQRMFLMVSANAQKPVIIQGFASTLCTREYFRLVIPFSFA